MSKSKRRFVFAIHEETRDLFRAYCRKHGFEMTKKLEIIIKEFLTTHK